VNEIRRNRLKIKAIKRKNNNRKKKPADLEGTAIEIAFLLSR
jgi:hypothetical protein